MNRYLVFKWLWDAVDGGMGDCHASYEWCVKATNDAEDWMKAGPRRSAHVYDCDQREIVWRDCDESGEI